MRKLCFLATVLGAALILGCGDKPEEHEQHDKHVESDVDTALKALSAEDQVLARAQKACPVSGEELGSMGTPIKVTGAGKTVFLCCEGCRKSFEKDPEKYVKKLD